MTKADSERANITEMLHEWGDGKREGLDDLLPFVLSELRHQASRYLRRERANHTLQTTALVNEAYLKLAGQNRVDWQNRQHFFAVAAQAMRRILVDYAKHRGREKRGGSNDDLPLEEALFEAAERTNVDIAALDEALTRLAVFDERQERLVELRYFGGMTLDEAADELGISRATAAREWQVAKAWLYRELTR